MASAETAGWWISLYVSGHMDSCVANKSESQNYLDDTFCRGLITVTENSESIFLALEKNWQFSDIQVRSLSKMAGNYSPMPCISATISCQVSTDPFVCF